MKYSIIIILAIFGIVPAFASNETTGVSMAAETYTTEKIPGLICEKVGTGDGPADRTYKCTLPEGAGSLHGIFLGFIKYATYLTGVIAILMLVVAGILYMFSGYSDEAKAKAKSLLTMVISGFILLYLIGFILNTIAPYIYK